MSLNVLCFSFLRCKYHLQGTGNGIASFVVRDSGNPSVQSVSAVSLMIVFTDWFYQGFIVMR